MRVSNFMIQYCKPKKLYSNISPKLQENYIYEYLNEYTIDFNLKVSEIYREVISFILNIFHKNIKNINSIRNECELVNCHKIR